MDYRFVLFVSASLLAHLALLGINHERLLPEIGGNTESLRVTLVMSDTRAAAAAPGPASVVAPTAPTPPATQQPVAHERQQRPREAQPAVVQITAQSKPESVVAAKTSRPSAPSRLASEQISAALQSELDRHFFYPWLARKRGWQGSVTLSLHVGSNGNLTQWKVAETSGYRVLDRSALDSAKRIQKLPQAAGLLNGTALNLLVPVHYRLLDS